MTARHFHLFFQKSLSPNPGNEFKYLPVISRCGNGVRFLFTITSGNGSWYLLTITICMLPSKWPLASSISSGSEYQYEILHLSLISYSCKTKFLPYQSLWPAWWRNIYVMLSVHYTICGYITEKNKFSLSLIFKFRINAIVFK